MPRRRTRKAADTTDKISFEFDNNGKTDEDGNFSGTVIVAADCPPGMYKLTVSDGENTAEVQLEVAAGDDGAKVVLDPEKVDLDGQNDAEADLTGSEFEPEAELTGTAESTDE